MKLSARKEDSHRLQTEKTTATRTAFGRPMVLVLAGTLLISGIATSARAADSDQRYRKMEDLLRSLVESELERYESRQNVPNEIMPKTKRSKPSSQLAQARPLLMRYSSEATNLTRDLDRQLDRRPAIRPIFGDALRVRAKAYVLAQNCMTTNDHEIVAHDFSALSADWQSLAYQLRQVRRLDSDVLEHVNAIDALDRDLGNLLKVSSRIDRQEVQEQLDILKADLESLHKSIDSELERSQRRRDLGALVHKLEEQIEQIASMVEGSAPYDAIVAEYRRFLSAWNPLAADLRTINNRTIERYVRRIDHSDYELHALLRLPHELNRARLLALTTTLMHQVDEFYLRAPLKLLITLPNGSTVIPTCNEFYGVCEHFADSVQQGTDHEQLLEDYNYVDSAWIAFQTMFRELNSSKAQAVLDDIERGIVSLREALQLNEGFDREEAVNLAAALLNRAEDFDSELKTWFERNPKSFRRAALQEAQGLVDAVHHFHDHLAGGGDQRQMQVEAADIALRWQRVHEYVKLCNGGDRFPLLRSSARITPLVVELGTKLEI